MIIRRRRHHTEATLRELRSNTYTEAASYPSSRALGDANPSNYASLLKQCGITKSLANAKSLHSRIASTGNDTGTFIANCIVEMYGKCGSIHDARQAFDRIPTKNVFSWTIMIAANAHNGHYTEAINLLERMDLEGVKPNSATFVSLISACTVLGCLQTGKRIHNRITASLEDINVVLATALIDMYGKCGCTGSARTLFDEMKHRNTVTWNAMISAYTKNAQGPLALQLFAKMDMEPDVSTFSALVNACNSDSEVKQLHALILCANLGSNLVIGTALIDTYGKCGSLTGSRRVFDGMPSMNVITWNVMIATYVRHGCNREALDIYKKMVWECIKPNKVTYTTLIGACCVPELLNSLHARVVQESLDEPGIETALVNMYGKCGILDTAKAIFDRMGRRSTVCWTTMMTGYVEQGRANEAFELYHRMELEGVKLDEVTYVSVLEVCSLRGVLPDGRAVHFRVLSEGFTPEGVLGNAVIKMYIKCGSLDDARGVFMGMKQKNVCSWNAIIGGCNEYGSHEEALVFYYKMDVEHDEVTFLNALGACRELGQGRTVHEHAVRGRISSVSVMNSLIDMYGRCGSVGEARRVFDGAERDIISWNTMIRVYVHQGLFCEALELYGEMDVEGNKSTFVTVLGACSSVEDAERMHTLIEKSGFEVDEALGSKLVGVYGRCGEIDKAVSLFKELRVRGSSAYTALITTLSLHGDANEAFGMLHQQEIEGVRGEEGVFLALISACSRAGMLETGIACFATMVSEYGFSPREEHYSCLVDLLGRAGWLESAEQVIEKCSSSYVAWVALLSACRTQQDSVTAARVSERVLVADHKSVPYILLATCSL